MKKSFLFLAEGFEEMEAIAIVDVLRRGGVPVETVSITGQRQVRGAHGVEVVADRTLDSVKNEQAECCIFPGGMPGAQHLGECKALTALMQRQYEEGRYLAAICAAPALVLGHLNAGRKIRLTCYPGFEKYLPENFEVSAEGVVADRQVITGKGPGFAVTFGLNLLEQLVSADVAKEVADGLLL